MFTLILLLILLWVVLVVLLAAWTLFYQGYIYTEPVTALEWRAPAAGAAVLVPLLLWIILDYQAPGNYRPLHDFNATESRKPFPELRVPAGKKEQVYKLRTAEGRLVYRLDGRDKGPQLPPHPDKIIAVEGDEKLEFERQPPQPRRWASLNRTEAVARYVARDSKGHELVMYEGELGQVTTFRTGRAFVIVLLNLLLVGGLFGALWPLLRFGWAIALLQAFVFWLVLTLFVLPPLLARTETVAHERAAARLT